MPKTNSVYPVPDVLPVIIVIALSAVAATAIAAWLVYQVARRAIDKVPPEGVTPVIYALSALLNPLRLFLPWRTRSELIQPPSHTGGPAQPSLHNETSPNLSPEAEHEA